jgi:hypothetical protein
MRHQYSPLNAIETLDLLRDFRLDERAKLLTELRR